MRRIPTLTVAPWSAGSPRPIGPRGSTVGKTPTAARGRSGRPGAGAAAPGKAGPRGLHLGQKDDSAEKSQSVEKCRSASDEGYGERQVMAWSPASSMRRASSQEYIRGWFLSKPRTRRCLPSSGVCVARHENRETRNLVWSSRRPAWRPLRRRPRKRSAGK